jgi:hypothetical protein
MGFATTFANLGATKSIAFPYKYLLKLPERQDLKNNLPYGTWLAHSAARPVAGAYRERDQIPLLPCAGLIGGRDPAVDRGALSQLNPFGFAARKPLRRLGRSLSNSVYSSTGT